MTVHADLNGNLLGVRVIDLKQPLLKSCCAFIGNEMNISNCIHIGLAREAVLACLI